MSVTEDALLAAIEADLAARGIGPQTHQDDIATQDVAPSGLFVPAAPGVDGVEQMAFMSAFEDDLPLEPSGGLDDGDGGFDENLALYLDQSKLDGLASKVIEWVRNDRASRKDWEDREAMGIVKLGVTSEQIGGIKAAMPTADWASTATHPGLMQACIQFWARAHGELWQAGAPAKAVVKGATTDERQQQAKRVAEYLNYLYNEDMPAGAQEMSRMLFRLPLSGSMFRKAFYDPIERIVDVKCIDGQDFVKPYSAVDLREAPRFTHVVRETRNDLIRMMAQGYYLKIRLTDPEHEASEHQTIDHALDNADGRQPGADRGEHDAEYDQRDILYETSCYLDLSDYDYLDPYGEDWGLPYLVTVHKTEQKVLAIRRNWREADVRKRRRMYVTEYKFLPGLGGYGWGLLHAAGGLSDAQTGFLRYLLDGSTLDTIGKLSGYCSQEAAGMSGLPPMKMGEFQKVPMSGDDMRKAFWSPEFKWTPNNTLGTLEYLDRVLATLVSSTETLVGDANKEMPVGTVLARIEQGLKPFATIFSLLHESFRRELRGVAELVADYLPPRYPYAVEGADQEVLALDFDERVDVVPASDPNVVTAVQRVAQAQAMRDIALQDMEVFQAPQRVEIYRHFFSVMRVANPDRFLPPPEAFAPPPPEALPPDPAEADIIRKDTIAEREQARKDYVAESEVQRKAQQMEADAALREQGNQAIQSRQQDQEIQRTAQEILDFAKARQMQLAGQAEPA
jgi:hypothetical protein